MGSTKVILVPTDFGDAAELALDHAIGPLSTLGDPRTCILEVAKETKADLIVMGTHGRRGLSRLILGSTAEAIVRTSPIPVLTIHAPAESKDVSAQSAKHA